MDGFSVRCASCGSGMRSALEFRCGCGSPFDLEVSFPFREPRREGCTLARYVANFPYLSERSLVSLGESATPLVETEGGALLKLDYMNPTGSFKDRGSAALVSALTCLSPPVAGIREDSSGNAGSSMAAYAARAGLGCHIFVPGTASGPKVRQIEAYGARLTVVDGPRVEVSAAAQRHQEGSVYVGHVWHPYFRDGMRTLAYEICEQMGWTAPHSIYCPVSAGTLLLGLIGGLRHMLSSGRIGRMPRIVAAQTAMVSPLCHRLAGTEYRPPPKFASVADALVSVDPPLLGLMVREMRAASGECVTVGEDEIVRAWRELSRLGFYAEPSSAVAYAAMKKDGPAGGEKRVVVLTGSGLKSAPNP
ncbi:MAG: pyridoxal-phosphate dependent enzyme [Nitrososphaerota archaeon]|nr:pyridoxal-phosphate dependent enzyme [Nitrososphaerota archaeon]